MVEEICRAVVYPCAAIVLLTLVVCCVAGLAAGGYVLVRILADAVGDFIRGRKRR